MKFYAAVCAFGLYLLVGLMIGFGLQPAIRNLPPFADISAEGWVIIIGAASLGIVQILTVIITFLNGREARAAAARASLEVNDVKATARQVAGKVEEVRITTEETAGKTVGKLDQIHQIVNSNNSKMETRIQELTEQLAEKGMVPKRTN
jgi:hypothetical protein